MTDIDDSTAPGPLIVRYADRESGDVRIGVRTAGKISPLPGLTRLSDLLTLPLAQIRDRVESAAAPSADEQDVLLLPPADGRMEVWASGVTYERSREARVEESTQATVYEQVYEAERPELFFKSVPWRVVTDREPIGVRSDSAVDVPEPELAVVANAHAEIVGYTVCNDVSSRQIEGDNPLYLPQAKIYAGSCALAAGIRPAWLVDDPHDLDISLTVDRGGHVLYSGTTSTRRMHRRIESLVEWLFRADHFPEGVVLATGTGLVPGLEMTLRRGDEVRIEISWVGSLTNPVVEGKAAMDWLLSPDTVRSRENGR
ncbi:2-dehydro-3-deoxy-D-arabinonate dehydratase [Streptomyces sp. V4I23]|uniref:fumarylacetoacetate hydrolase family protein n=1 Tax=Streptomyces sp. V4I23 TaxID=3042282 RepID=UPI0027861FB9|nr:fumarylacetoacetate hydrolase family protein [Streptomyces sp. V4I23]MDQ1008766.1 2-dehydro-3-deoxy-D-arabinonate dehydratase [Streptomyces sp. V4I23]